jgi:probable rRNA maturation factor
MTFCDDRSILLVVTLIPIKLEILQFFFSHMWQIFIQEPEDVKYAINSSLVSYVVLDTLQETASEGRSLCNGNIEVSFLKPDDIQSINNEYRQKDYVTDVLSFAYGSSASTKEETFFSETVGEILICLEQAEQQAASFQNSFGEEVVRLLIHGTLHLCGYDHENVSESEEQKMVGLEDQLSTKHVASAATIITMEKLL